MLDTFPITEQPRLTSQPTDPVPHRPSVFGTLVRRVSVGGSVIAALGCVLVPSTGLIGIEAWLVISIASILIAFTSGIPSWRADRYRHLDESATGQLNSDDFLHEIFGCMTLRVVGTVALFLACRYLLVDPKVPIAIAVIGWYLFLATVETATLLSLGLRTHSTPNHASSKR